MSAISRSPSNNLIVIEANQVGGLGDISAAFKIASVLVQGGIAKERIVISLEELKTAELFNKPGFSVISHAEKNKVSDVALQIFFPDMRGYVYPDVPILRLEEYDADPAVQSRRIEEGRALFGEQFHYEALGLGGLGIIIDHELSVFSETHSISSPTHLRPLQSLSSSLREILLGSIGKDEALLERFFASQRLYVGHVSSFKTAYSFFSAITSLNKEESRSLHICMTLSPDKMPHLEKFAQSLMNQGLGRVVINAYNAEEKVFKKILEVHAAEAEAAAKTLTITLGPFSQEDMRYLWMASEPESIVTGDQSLSEAISSRKKFVYECRTHKTGVASKLQNLFVKYAGGASVSLVLTPTFDPAALLRMYSFTQRGALDAMQAMDEFIIKTKDCARALIDCVHRLEKK